MTRSRNNPPDNLSEEDLRDAALMLQIRDGNKEAFRTLVEEHQNRVFGTIVRMLGDLSDTEDLAQQVFLRVWKSAKRYRPDAKFTTWLYTITRNLVYNEIRRRKRHPTDSLEDTSFEQERQFADTNTASPDNQFLENELQINVQKAIGQLPKKQRMALVLRSYEELSYEEIADALGTSVSSVKSLLFRARTELKERLQHYLK